MTNFARDVSDATAMELIHALLDAQEWSPDTLDAIADVVRMTGREVGNSDEVESELESD